MAALGPSVLAVTAAEALKVKARSARAALAVLRLEEPEPEPEPETLSAAPTLALKQEADADADAAPGAAPGAAPELEPVAPGAPAPRRQAARRWGPKPPERTIDELAFALRNPVDRAFTRSLLEQLLAALLHRPAVRDLFRSRGGLAMLAPVLQDGAERRPPALRELTAVDASMQTLCAEAAGAAAIDCALNRQAARDCGLSAAVASFLGRTARDALAHGGGKLRRQCQAAAWSLLQLSGGEEAKQAEPPPPPGCVSRLAAALGEDASWGGLALNAELVEGLRQQLDPAAKAEAEKERPEAAKDEAREDGGRAESGG